ncbi:AAA-ATPase [Gordonia phage Gibbles]|nr:AAA-ATPase [Gordonia phage Gibbles]
MTSMPSVPDVTKKNPDGTLKLQKNCRTCIHFIDGKKPNVSSRLFGDTVGNDVCAKFGRIISNTNDSPENTIKIQDSIASNCDEWETSAISPAINSEPAEYNHKWITLGIPTFDPGPRNSDQEKPASCAFCAFRRAPINAVSAEIGVESTLPACTVYGTLILPGQGAPIARTCHKGVKGPNSDNNIATVDIFPDMVLDIAPENMKFDDPLDYQTDQLVSEEDKKIHGIQAWRKVTEPNGTRYIMMPIFNPSSFNDEDRKNIPRPGDDEHPELYLDHLGLLYRMLALWKMGFTPSLSGTAGVGKTEAFRFIAYQMQLPFRRVSINNSTDIDHLAGKTEYAKDIGTYFQMGVIPKAWNSRCVLVIDEPNVGPPDVWQFFRPLTDNSKQLVLDMDKGQKIPKNEHCYFGMAMNPVWDILNVGTHEIGDADARRLMHIYVPPPDAATEKQIIMERCLTDGYALPTSLYNTISRIVNVIRAQSASDTLPFRWGTAQTIKVALATQYFNIVDCFRLAIVDFIDPDSGEIVLGIVKSNSR